MAKKLMEIPAKLTEVSDIESILCTGALLAAGLISDTDHPFRAMRKFFQVDMEENCNNCPLFNRCLACIINE